MSKILIVAPMCGAVAAAHRRVEAWRRSLVNLGHEVVDLPEFERCPEDCVARIGREAPDAVLTVSVESALRVAALDIDGPLWIDVLKGDVATESALSGDRPDVEWSRLGCMLDRADLITCACLEVQTTVVTWLGCRGRLDANPAAGDLVRLEELPSQPSDGLRSWWGAPRRADGSFESPANRERWLIDHAGKLTHELNQIHASKMWTVWMGSIRAREVVKMWRVWILRGPTRIARSIIRALGWLYLALGTGKRLATSGLRRRLPARWLMPRQIDATPVISRVSGSRPRVLIVTPYPIIPAHHGGAVRIFNLIKLLSRDADLFLLVITRRTDDRVQREALERWVKKVWLHPQRFDPQRQTETSVFDLNPPSVRLFLDDRIALLIRDIVETNQIDVVQLEYTEMAQYRHSVGDVPVILVEHDVSIRSLERRRRIDLPRRYPASRIYGQSYRDWMSLMRFEIQACREVDQLHMMSVDDAEYLAAFLPDSSRRMVVVPNGVETLHFSPPNPAPERSGALLVGNFHTLPNLDAFEVLTQQIWPLVRRLQLDAKLSVIGADMRPEMFDWDGREGINVVGSVPDIREAYHRHQVLLVPLRAGSGTRLKLLEAFASGIPVVSTRIGAEGIDCVAGKHLLIADEPDDFARAVDSLLDDPELSATIAEQAGELVRERYDWSVSADLLSDGLRRLGSDIPKKRVEIWPVANESPRAVGGSADSDITISVVVPTYRGGEKLARCLSSLASQQIDRRFEVLCIDSGSDETDLALMRDHGARVFGIAKVDFNHGLTRDLGAELTLGEVLVFLNQDAIPADTNWLQELTAPLFAANPPAAVQGAMRDFQRGEGPFRPFYWGTCGPRFYFTREMRRWVGLYPGPSFSTVSAAIRRDVWQSMRFGWAPIMEDKKWQRSALEENLSIVEAPNAVVFHSHDYDLAWLYNRCRDEGVGWRLLGEHYTFTDMVADLWQPQMWVEAARGLWSHGFDMSSAEVLFPLLRPFALWRGNRRQTELKV